MTTELTVFVRDALSAGKSRDEVRAVLVRAGWIGDEIDDALSRFADVEFPVPVPVRRQSGSAREAFLYLVTFLALYTFAIAFGNLLCGLVDTAMPDPVQDPYYAEDRSEGFRWLLASIIVSFPVYMILTRLHLVSYARDPERRSSAVRRWLTYLTLAVAASTALVTMIVMIANFLGGEQVVRSLMKSAIVIVLSGSVFGYYLWELRGVERQAPK